MTRYLVEAHRGVAIREREDDVLVVSAKNGVCRVRRADLLDVGPRWAGATEDGIPGIGIRTVHGHISVLAYDTLEIRDQAYDAIVKFVEGKVDLR